jgi:hypothetical protein
MTPETAAEPGGIRAIRTPGEYIPLKGAQRLHLMATIEYEIIPIDDPQRGPWKISTRKYRYHVVTDDHTEVVLYHWHPGSKTDLAHVHLGSSQLMPNAVVDSHDHMPTGRISLESVLAYLITDLGVVALRKDYLQVLAKNNSNFETWRTWSTTSGPPGPSGLSER